MLRGWHDWIGTYTGVVLITMAELPFVALAVCALALRRRAGGASHGRAWGRSLSEVGLVYGTLPWLWAIMIPGSRAGAVPGRVSLVPLRDLLAIAAGDTGTAVGQIVGNLLVFAALGALAPLRFRSLASVWRVLALAAALSILLEILQYVLRLDRVSSVDDVLLNTSGAGLAALVTRRWWPAATEGGRSD
ncbi:VanZ family protein [Actinomadura logoneensis]|uniref:VanZ family protein n=1 Tax=Actinomadura logoneensis TaxID=2293572 RepID=A0A372JNQ6_9ACTN|nr:VanZ family protein [Actinomadura logoneensis]RFU41657.1 VanZ family protein [Actinomadura logoneensis]